MAELKTLKDIPEYSKDCDHTTNDPDLCTGCIRREAIKWAKFRRIKIDSDFCEFLNITEESLLIAEIEDTPPPVFETDGTKHITTS